jgi:hypothetical protein
LKVISYYNYLKDSFGAKEGFDGLNCCSGEKSMGLEKKFIARLRVDEV